MMMQQRLAQGIVAGSVGGEQAAGDVRAEGTAIVSGSTAEQPAQELRPQQPAQQAAQTHSPPGVDTVEDTSGGLPCQVGFLVASRLR